MLKNHTASGEPYASCASTERLANEDIDASVASVGDAYGSALAGSQTGLYGFELIYREGLGRDVARVEAVATE